MRVLKLAIAALVVTPIVLMALASIRPSGGLRAQLVGPPQPLPVPPPPPGVAPTPLAVAPGALPSLGAPAAAAPLATPGALPPLNLPQVAVASPSPAATPRIFACSCSGPATYTHWIGNVIGTNYFSARQVAVNQCLAFNFNRRPQPAFIQPPTFAFFPTPSAPISGSVAEPGLPNLQAPGLSGFALLNSPRAQVLSQCQNCTCD